MNKNILYFISLTVAVTCMTSCSQFWGDLRKDWGKDSGKDWDESEAAVERTDRISARDSTAPEAYEPERRSRNRAPADDTQRRPVPVRNGGNQNSWISEHSLEENSRETLRPSPENSLDRPLISSGTVPHVEPVAQREYKRINRVTKSDFVDQSQEEGSLWASSGQINYFFTKNRIKNPGDLIALTVEADLHKDIGVEVKRTLSSREQADEVGIIQDKIRKKFFADLEKKLKKDNLTTNASAPDRSPASEKKESAKGQEKSSASGKESPLLNQQANLADAADFADLADPANLKLPAEQLERLIPRASMTDVDIYPSLEVKPGDLMMGEIIERYPNGNYKIRTLKRILYKNGPPRLVSVVGVVRSTDMSEENDAIKSGKLYEYHIEVSH